MRYWPPKCVPVAPAPRLPHVWTAALLLVHQISPQRTKHDADYNWWILSTTTALLHRSSRATVFLDFAICFPSPLLGTSHRRCKARRNGETAQTVEFPPGRIYYFEWLKLFYSGVWWKHSSFLSSKPSSLSALQFELHNPWPRFHDLKFLPVIQVETQ